MRRDRAGEDGVVRARLTDEDIIRMYRDGVSRQQIFASDNRLRIVLARAGVPRRSPGRPRETNPTITNDEIVRMYRSGAKWKDIPASPTRIATALRHAGVPMQRPQGHAKPTPPPPAPRAFHPTRNAERHLPFRPELAPPPLPVVVDPPPATGSGFGSACMNARMERNGGAHDESCERTHNDAWRQGAGV